MTEVNNSKDVFLEGVPLSGHLLVGIEVCQLQWLQA